MRHLRLGLAVGLAAVGSACIEDESSPAPTEPEAIGTWPVRPIARVRLNPATAADGVPRSNEVRGLVTGLVDLGLSDLEGVVVHTEGAPDPLGTALPLETGALGWTVNLAVGGDGTTLIVGLELCDRFQGCLTQEGSGPRESPQLAVSQVLRSAAAQLGRWPSRAVLESWERPLSSDPYAVLLAGRGAAAFYGVIPAAQGALVGHGRLDPIDRAVLVDPYIPASAWLLSRRDAGREELDRARVPLTRARAARPWNPVLAADEAALVDRVGRPQNALIAWQEVARQATFDARFVRPLASAWIRAGQPERAADLLDHLPIEFQGERAVVELRVRIADSAPTRAQDPLLAQWQEAAPDDPEPVRRRIALRVLARTYADALALTPELSRRGAGPEADRLAVALGAGAGDWEAARAAAERLGQAALVARIDARLALAAAPDRLEGLEGDRSIGAAAAQGAVLLASGRADEALALARGRLASEPWRPELLALEADALRALGKEAEAQRVADRLAWADPGWSSR